MQSNFRTISLVTKNDHTQSSQVAGQIIDWLSARGLNASIVDHSGMDDDSGNNEKLLQSDLVLVAGGDGTTIRTARKLVGSNIPIVGVNFGRVGFLPELSVDNWRDALGAALDNGLATEPRMALEFRIMRSGKPEARGYAVNDVVLSRGGMARLAAFNLAVDGKKLSYLRADGLIMATPTGATAYASSAGGPLIHPSLNVYSTTAICPFISHMLPLVLGAEATLSVEIREAGSDTFATVDGQELYTLHAGDVLQVKGVPGGMLFGRFGISDYFDKLRYAGFLYDSPGNTAP